jgi:hypothetical protein
MAEKQKPARRSVTKAAKRLANRKTPKSLKSIYGRIMADEKNDPEPHRDRKKAPRTLRKRVVKRTVERARRRVSRR